MLSQMLSRSHLGTPEGHIDPDTVVRHALAPKTATHSILTRTHVPTRLVTLALNQPPIIMMMTTTTAATTRHAQQHTPYFLKK